MAIITAIDKGSVGEELGLEVGDELLGFNGEKIVDVLDYVYYDSQDSFILNIKAKQGDIVDIEIEKDENETLGLTLDESVQLEPMRCKNKCVFCFVDQLPKGMRDTLYVKDDDYRLSFVSGNYVTFSNIGQKELDRIAKLRLSPLYISVHAYDKDIKTKLVSNPESARVFEKMEFLAAHSIKMHTQIVLCKGLNDGKVLDQTLLELRKLYPQVQSVAVIPVGLTCHRDGLYPLETFDEKSSREVVKQVESFNKKCGGDFCWCSDEFYIKAGLDMPEYSKYGDFCQIENGVGLCAEFANSFDLALEKAKPSDKELEIAIITGQSFKNILAGLLDGLKDKFPNVRVRICDIYNDFFGRSITVSGLVTPTDIIKQVKDMPKYTVIPSTMLREFTDTFLDGYTVAELEKAINSKILVSHGGESLVGIIADLAAGSKK
ncbi:MAG: DUF512 domain-containing protein [Clostridia bacterium]|nr:DUF512 domain-containing protein [Clostridia bacterium]